MNACKASNIGIISVDCIKVSFLDLLVYCSYARCYHCEELGKKYLGPPGIYFGNFCESSVISK